MGFSRWQNWSGLPFPLPEDLPNPGIEPTSLMSPILTGRFFTTGKQTVFSDFPGSSASKESTHKTGDPQSIPGLGRSHREGMGYPLQFSWRSLMAQLVKNSPLGHNYHIETYIEIKSHFSFTHLSLCSSKEHDSFLSIYPAHFSPSVPSGNLCVIFLCECSIFPLNMAISVWYLAYRKTHDFYIILNYWSW